jgi:hypothetical protein
MPNLTRLILTVCGIELALSGAIIPTFTAADRNGRFLTLYGGEKVSFFGPIVSKNHNNQGLSRPQPQWENTRTVAYIRVSKND